ALRPYGGARLGIHEGAAAGCQHLRSAFQKPGDDALLAGAEIRLAIGGEDFRDRHAGCGLDLGVRINDAHAAAAREPPPDRRLADIRVRSRPSLIRLLMFVGLLGAAAYGAMFALANFVQPKQREMTITIPAQRLTKPN